MPNAMTDRSVSRRFPRGPDAHRPAPLPADIDRGTESAYVTDV
jgi:hypothetical protein